MASTDLTRHQFLQLSLGAAAASLVGCSDDGVPADETGSNGTGASTSDPATSPTDPSSATSGETMPPTTDPTTGPATSDSSDPGETDTGDSGTTAGGSSGTAGGSGSTGTGTGTGTGSSSSGSSSESSGDDCGMGVQDTAISNNHGHAVEISADMLQPGTPLNDIDIQGVADHPHTISLSGDNVDNLLAGGSVTVTSSFDGHDHDVTVACA